MSLLESLVSLAILAVAAVGFLGSFQQAARSARAAELWLRGTQIAESVMEARKSGAEPLPNEPGFAATVEERPFVPGLVVIDVAVQLPDGQRMTLRRVNPE
ncbi:MAG: type IV pilus modification PilV family protein [Gemmatimonadaceae bacterium]